MLNARCCDHMPLFLEQQRFTFHESENGAHLKSCALCLGVCQRGCLLDQDHTSTNKDIFATTCRREDSDEPRYTDHPRGAKELLSFLQVLKHVSPSLSRCVSFT